LLRAGEAAAGEGLRRPLAARSDRLQRAARVRRPRLADRLEERQVLLAVGVEEALRQIEAELVGEAARRDRLPLAVAERVDELAGVLAALHLEPRHQHVLDAELARDRLDLIARRRR